MSSSYGSSQPPSGPTATNILRGPPSGKSTSAILLTESITSTSPSMLLLSSASPIFLLGCAITRATAPGGNMSSSSSSRNTFSLFVTVTFGSTTSPHCASPSTSSPLSTSGLRNTCEPK
eukprot:CAMPEP_0172547464 /NCGR_PEP_ID=MMETSP1067-20121228/16996_1 /TAXON_ID=265564 ORGANISM="Thalassiosira punctigera, Strain Tpunct2005C2" /NCGR_SAMPLE_ID=MMETSP1067 /ASSEMBLY_ACC=CAM_ASM_000444 /LENGTH=118 /DNA_ID=CAMNT_0013334547 /DNA_START=167 /DNA_END=523 /DNA_ORIENTATION=-